MTTSECGVLYVLHFFLPFFVFFFFVIGSGTFHPHYERLLLSQPRLHAKIRVHSLCSWFFTEFILFSGSLVIYSKMSESVAMEIVRQRRVHERLVRRLSRGLGNAKECLRRRYHETSMAITSVPRSTPQMPMVVPAQRLKASLREPYGRESVADAVQDAKMALGGEESGYGTKGYRKTVEFSRCLERASRASSVSPTLRFWPGGVRVQSRDAETCNIPVVLRKPAK